MPVSPDFHDILVIFVYNNLPILMNPANARNVVVSTSIVPMTPTTPTTPTSTTTLASTTPVITIDPSFLQALQAAALNNFTNLGLPLDIQQIAQNFFSNLPPSILSSTATTTVVTSTAATTITG